MRNVKQNYYPIKAGKETSNAKTGRMAQDPPNIQNRHHDNRAEIRKISIDLEIPESEVFRYAILNLIEQYRKTPVDELIRNSQLLLAKPEMHESKNNVKSNNT